MTVTKPLDRLEELVARRHELLKRASVEKDPIVLKSFKIELRLVSREAQRLVSVLSSSEDTRAIAKAIYAGMDSVNNG